VDFVRDFGSEIGSTYGISLGNTARERERERMKGRPTVISLVVWLTGLDISKLTGDGLLAISLIVLFGGLISPDGLGGGGSEVVDGLHVVW
jgi:hypothetical protein